jgi:CheY-like chemotaxis protein
MNKTVLLVDDVQMMIEIEKEFLQNSYVEILSAKDGLQALDIAQTRHPDLIFMDLQMPVMDGATCCRKIKSVDGLKEIPVVMVTTKGREEDVETCFAAGCDGFLTKPLFREQFLETARKFIPGIERREKRVPVSFTGVVNIGDTTLACSMRDLSIGGALVETDYPVAPDSVLRISFALPDRSKIECHGRVVWINRTSSKCPVGFGVKFSILPKDARIALATFVDSVA